MTHDYNSGSSKTVKISNIAGIRDVHKLAKLEVSVPVSKILHLDVV